MVNSTNFDLIHIPRWSQISGTFNWWGVGGGWEGGLWHGFHGEKGGWEEAVQSDRDRHCADSLWWPSRLRDPIHAPRKKSLWENSQPWGEEVQDPAWGATETQPQSPGSGKQPHFMHQCRTWDTDDFHPPTATFWMTLYQPGKPGRRGSLLFPSVNSESHSVGFTQLSTKV